jgi:hypothetical protein
MSLRWCESPGYAARIAAQSADQAPTAIIGCPHMTMPERWLRLNIAGIASSFSAVRSCLTCAEDG